MTPLAMIRETSVTTGVPSTANCSSVATSAGRTVHLMQNVWGNVIRYQAQIRRFSHLSASCFSTRYDSPCGLPLLPLTFSLRMEEDMFAERRIIVTHQTIPTPEEKIGREYAKNIRRRLAGKFYSKRSLDDVVITMPGVKNWHWRAVDQDGFVLDLLVQSLRNAKSAKRLMRKLLKAQGTAARVMVTDRLRSY